jgi:predicted GIY-YIG superfamily endonuclease
MYVYVLELENEKFYAGLSLKGDPFKRIRNHYKANGARYTQNNRVLKLMLLQEISDTLEELIYTLRLMKTYGISQVRGDKYIQRHINDFERNEISNLLINLDVPCTLIVSKANKIIIKDDIKFDDKKHKFEICFPHDEVQKIILVLRCIEAFGLTMVENDIYNDSDANSVCMHLRHSNQQCMKCGSCEHFAKSCPLEEFEFDEAFLSDKTKTTICEQTILRFCRSISKSNISIKSQNTETKMTQDAWLMKTARAR